MRYVALIVLSSLIPIGVWFIALHWWTAYPTIALMIFLESILYRKQMMRNYGNTSVSDERMILAMYRYIEQYKGGESN